MCSQCRCCHCGIGGTIYPFWHSTFFHRPLSALHRPVPKLTETETGMLQAYSWPGNVRELQNVTERALILSPRGTLEFDFPELVSVRGEPLPGTGPAHAD